MTIVLAIFVLAMLALIWQVTILERKVDAVVHLLTDPLSVTSWLGQLPEDELLSSRDIPVLDEGP